MDTNTIRTKTDAELAKLLAEQEDLLATLRFRARVRELKNVHEIRHARRMIARILTILHERSWKQSMAKAHAAERGARD